MTELEAAVDIAILIAVRDNRECFWIAKEGIVVRNREIVVIISLST